MKNQILPLIGLLPLLGISTPAFAETAVKPECATVVEHLTSEVKKDATRLLLAVEDALTLNDKCACEIVTAAIQLSKADSDMVGRIVSTSIQAAPTSASSIAECALSAAPESASSIQSAMKKALGQGDVDTSTSQGDANGKEVVGKEPVAMTGNGKEVLGKGKVPIDPIPEKPTEPDVDWSPMLNTAGVYLFTPAGGGGFGGETEIIKQTKVIIKKEEKIIRIVVRESTNSR
jgi:hypothetical protein